MIAIIFVLLIMIAVSALKMDDMGCVIPAAIFLLIVIIGLIASSC